MRSMSPDDSPAPRIQRHGHREFSDGTLATLVEALRARTTAHPDNPGLIAFWPGVREERMAAACAELRLRGHPVFQTPVTSSVGKPRTGWAIAAATDEPAWPGLPSTA
jgi:hypothetical protein